jgi:pimeloyl-ACP methyl ester carboxylesterase
MVDQRRDPEHRRSPEALLEAARREEGRIGMLKIFVGAAPGVGKTYEMLQQARAGRKDGYGCHRRRGRLTAGKRRKRLEIIPRRRMEYKGQWLEEMSVGGADGRLVSERVIEANWTVAIGASPIGTLACVDAWIEDIRKDIPRNDVPTMIIHGDDDRILPADATSRRQAKMIKNVKYVEIKGGPHGITWTRAEQINAELVPFLA